MSKNDYRERPRTGVTPEPGEPRNRPAKVDPSVLTDDREDADLLVFEKTWGHRMLAGLGYAMIVVGLVLIIYCAIRLSGFVSLMAGENAMLTVGLMVYGAGLVAGILVIPPAIVALWVARKPRHATIAIALAAVGIALVLVFIGYALFTGATVFSALLYGGLFAVLPVLYLVAAIKVKRS